MKDVKVGLVVSAILDVQAGFVAVEAVTVFHRELAHADQAGARAWIITPFSLDVVEQLRQLPVGLNFILGDYGFLNPIMAAAAMAISSLTVVSNSLRLRRFKPF